MEPERIHPGFVSVNRDSGKDTLIYLIFVSFGSLLSFLVLFLHVRQFIKCIFNSASKTFLPGAPTGYPMDQRLGCSRWLLRCLEYESQDCDDKISEMSLKVYAAVVFVQCSKAV